jgi:chromosome segregation ATPase
MTGARLLAAGLVAVALLTGCGGDDEPAAVGWADDLCSSVSEWRTSVTETTDALREGPTQADDLREAGEELEAATEDLVDDLRGLGRPETESGEQAEAALDELADSVDRNLDAVRSAVEDVGDLSAALEAATAVTAALSELQEALSSTVDELRQLDPGGELEEAFGEAESCDGS